MKITLNSLEFKLINNYKDGFDREELENKITDYFNDYDYIVGDWSYGKLRLKGFCNKKNPKLSDINDYSNLDNYIKKQCSYDCRYFVLEKLNEEDK